MNMTDPILTNPDFLALPEDLDLLSRFRTLDTIPEEEAQWLVPGYLPQGQITLLAADGGVGKTTFWCQLLGALSSGRLAGLSAGRRGTDTFTPAEPEQIR